MKKIEKIAGVILLTGSSLFVSASQVKAQSEKNLSKTKNTKETTLRLEVDGMYCQRFCANGTDTMLAHLSGILFSRTTFATKSSVVKYNPSLITPEKIIQAIDERGFEAKTEKEK